MAIGDVLYCKTPFPPTTHGFLIPRLECLKLIQNGFADFAPFEPEDMYVSAKFMDDTLAVFLEMRDVLTQLGILMEPVFQWKKLC